jgi:hypothetical protein
MKGYLKVGMIGVQQELMMEEFCNTMEIQSIKIL